MSRLTHYNIIPSFFSRLYAIEVSFSMIAEKINKDGKRAERGDSANHHYVNDTLDLLELLFLYGRHPALRAEHYNLQNFESESEWSRMMKKDLSIDEQLIKHSKDWILFSWEGKLIGGTSPFTLVYPVPDICNRNIQLPSVHGRVLFDNDITPLTKRDLRFQQYMMSLYLHHPMPTAIHSYLKEIEKLLTHDPLIRKEDFEELPCFNDIPNVVVNDICLQCLTEYPSQISTNNRQYKSENPHHEEPISDQDRKRIFLSYKRVDKEKVFELQSIIENGVGEKCWIDLLGVESDAQFASVIIDAINNVDIFLYLYSKAHKEIRDFENDWTIRELNYAQSKNKRIVFVNIDNSVLIDYLTFMFPNKQQVDALSNTAMQKLLTDIREWLN